MARSTPSQPGSAKTRNPATRQHEVEPPEARDGIADTTGKRLGLGAGQLGLEQLPAADPEAWEHRQAERDHADATQPDGQLAPDLNGDRERRGVGCRARARGGKARHPLEEGIDRPAELGVIRKDGGQRPVRPGEEPNERNDEVALADPYLLGAPGGPLDCKPKAADECPRDQERPDRLRVPDREQRRHGRREAKILDERPDEVDRGGEVDAEPRRAPGPAHRRERHRARSTMGARAASVKTTTRPPASRASSLEGKITSPLRTIAPMSAPWIGMSRSDKPTSLLSRRVVMSRISKRSPSSIATCFVRGSCAKRTISSAVMRRGLIATSTPARSKTSIECASWTIAMVNWTPLIFTSVAA